MSTVVAMAAGFVSKTQLHTPLSRLLAPVALQVSRQRRTFTATRAQRGEESAAKEAAKSNVEGGPTIFDKILSKEIPSTIAELT